MIQGHKFLRIVVALVWFGGVLFFPIVMGSALTLPCTTPTSTTSGNLCIIELQTKGATGNEDEDFVIIANPTSFSITLSSVQLQYINSNGVLDASISAGSGSMAPGQTKAFVSDSLVPMNSSLSKLTASSAKLSFASSGGTLQIAKVLSSGTTVYDRVGWGNDAVNEKTPAPLQDIASTLVRRQVNNIFQDTDDNGMDITQQPLACRGAGISEIQPFVTDVLGQSVDAWVELIGTSGVQGDCGMLTAAGDVYTIPVVDLPQTTGQLALVNGGINPLGQTVPLHIGDTSGQIWISGSSFFGAQSSVRIPFTTQQYSSLVKGQTWALVGGIWHRTYEQTPEQLNIYAATPPAEPSNPTACTAVRISEIFPNPAGDESGKEWIELHNESDQSASLDMCLVNIAGTVYNFLSDDVLAPDEWRAAAGLYNSDGDAKNITLRNTEDTLIALQRQNGNVIDTIQSFVYGGAPEGESYARFDDGWRWTFAPTPSLANILEEALPEPSVTEFPAVAEPNNSGSSGGQGTEAISAQITITELLPNPALPATDDTDEFVELYNAGTEPISLSGYKLETGLDYSHSVILGNQTIEPGGFIVIMSGATSLSLTNSGGRVRLLSPESVVMSESDAYGEAVEGESWALIGGVWQWTAKPTPSVTNVYATPVVIPGRTQTTTTKKASTKVATAPKVKAAATVKTAATKKPVSTKDGKTTSQQDNSAEGEKSTVHTAVIAGIGGLAVLYGAYEYRGDITNTVYKFKRDRATRRANRP